MSSKYEQTLDEIRVLVKNNEILESDNKALSDELVNLTNEIGKLKSQNANLYKSYIEKSEECDIESKKNADLHNTISDLKTELDMYKRLSAFGSHYKIKTGSMNPGEVNMTLELNDRFSVTVTERWDTYE